MGVPECNTGEPCAVKMASTVRRGDRKSARKERLACFLPYSAWDRIAEACNEFLKKGHKILVEREMKESQPWQDRQGNWRASLDLRANNVRFLTTRAEAEEDIPF